MKIPITTLGIALILTVAGGTSGAQGTQGDPNGSAPGTPKPAAGATSNAIQLLPVAVRLKTDKKAYHTNEPIKMTLMARNTSKQPVTVPFNSGQRYDIEIRKGTKPNGEKVWQWARGRMFAQMLSQQTLAPGQTLTFHETAAPSDRANPEANLKLTPGTYKITATLTTGSNTPRPFDTATIQVK